jgi:hypothetical protein
MYPLNTVECSSVVSCIIWGPINIQHCGKMAFNVYKLNLGMLLHSYFWFCKVAVFMTCDLKIELDEYLKIKILASLAFSRVGDSQHIRCKISSVFIVVYNAVMPILI